MPVSAPQRPASPGSASRFPTFAATAPDTTLVGLAARGDERAFELLFQRHRPDVQAYATRMLRDHGRAEDVVQDVFVSAMRAIRGAAPEVQPVHVRAWLREIARKACIDQWRGSTRRGEVSLDAPDGLGADDVLRLSDDSLTRATDDRRAMATLRLAFDDLPELQHAVLVQRELEGRSIPEIADRLGLTPTVVEGQLSRGRRALGRAYKELDSGERCVAVRALCDSSTGGRLGVRDRHRLGSHVRGCDDCRRYAHRSGVDPRLVDRTLLSRASMLLPLPLLRRLPFEPGLAGETAGGILGAKALVGAAMMAAAGGGGAYVATVAPTTAPAPRTTAAGSPSASPFGLSAGPDGRPVLRVVGAGGPVVPAAGGAAGVLGARPFLPPWLASPEGDAGAPASSARRSGPRPDAVLTAPVAAPDAASSEPSAPSAPVGGPGVAAPVSGASPASSEPDATPPGKDAPSAAAPLTPRPPASSPDDDAPPAGSGDATTPPADAPAENTGDDAPEPAAAPVEAGPEPVAADPVDDPSVPAELPGPADGTGSADTTVPADGTAATDATAPAGAPVPDATEPTDAPAPDGGAAPTEPTPPDDTTAPADATSPIDASASVDAPPSADTTAPVPAPGPDGGTSVDG